MKRHRVLTLAFSLASYLFPTVSADSLGAESSPFLLRESDVLRRRYLDIIHDYRSHDNSLAARADAQEGNTPAIHRGADQTAYQYISNTQLNADGTVNQTQWETATDTACQKKMSTMTRASNPFGVCVCYNLVSLDMQTGVFAADLRAYQIGPPTDDLAGILPGDVSVSLRFAGAVVNTVKENSTDTASDSGNSSTTSNNTTTTNAKRSIGSLYEDDPEDDESNDRGLVARQDDSSGGRDPVPLLQKYMLAGRIDENQTNKAFQDMTMSDLEVAVMPIVTLAAGGTRMNVSVNEAIFLNGVFSQDVVLSPVAEAQLQVNDVMDQLGNGTVAFVLPGVQLMVFPIGLIITSVWLVGGLLVYGFGTYERIQHVAAYKRRKALGGVRVSTF